jgi:hypothetical protein
MRTEAAPAAGVIGARMTGCSMSKNFVNRVLIIAVPSLFCSQFGSPFRYEVAALFVESGRSAFDKHAMQNRKTISLDHWYLEYRLPRAALKSSFCR